MVEAALRHPVRCRAVSRDMLGSLDVLSRRRQPWRTPWLDRDWSFALVGTQCQDGPPTGHFLEVAWGEGRVVVGLSPTDAAALIEAALPGERLQGWPAALAVVALEFAGRELADAVETLSRKPLRAVTWSEVPPGLEGMHRLGWRAEGGACLLEGQLWLDATACRVLAAQLRGVPLALRRADWLALPLAVHLLVGWVDVSANLVTRIGLHDVLVLDECLISPAGQLTLQLGSRRGLRGQLEGTLFRAIEGIQDTMSDTVPSSAAIAESAPLLDDIPVRLSFDLGDREITFGELGALLPGHIFNLGRDPRSTVSIRANGRLIGEGELVDIEGRIGVCVLRLQAPAH